MRTLHNVLAVWLCLLAGVLVMSFAPAASAQSGTGVVTGVVADVSDKKPIGDVVVTLTSPALQGEQVVVTDGSGFYRIPDLPPGAYALRLEKDGFKPYTRDGVALRADATLRINAEMLPDSLKAEEVTVVVRPPTVDIGSSTTGTNISSEFTRRVPVSPPGGKGAASRSFESVAVVAPGAQANDFGVSIAGATSNENSYVIDGLSVNNPGFGYVGTPLSSEFVEEMNVITGGYMPEYGRSTGGIMNAVTKSGSNEFHGGIWSFYSPGGLEGSRHPVKKEGTTVGWEPSLSYLGDIGFDVGGPLLKDKLWFYTGFDIARTRYNIKRTVSRLVVDSAGNPVVDGSGFTQTEPIPDNEQTYPAESTNLQVMGKLTYAVDANNKLTLTGYVLPSWSGGNGKFAIDPTSGKSEVGTDSNAGNYGSIGHTQDTTSYDASLKWSTEFDNKRVLVDTTIGWHHESASLLPVDGSQPGSGVGLSNQWNVLWQRDPPHSLTEFENFPNSNLCKPTVGTTNLCPVSNYVTGGPGDIWAHRFNRYSANSVLTYLFQGAGHHVVKAGASVELTQYHDVKGDTGGSQVQEHADGSSVDDLWQLGVLVAPDTPAYLEPFVYNTKSVIAGGFLQDSWSVMDMVTLNIGLRYDAQMLYSSDGALGMTLPNEWSPRVGFIYDYTQSGRSKIFVNYARYYENVPLDLADASLTGEPYIQSSHNKATCDAVDPAQQHSPTRCQAPDNRLNVNGITSPDRKWGGFGAGSEPIDPDIKPQSSDELVAGAEYEAFPDGRFGTTYTKRWIDHAIEDMSNDNAATFFIGNPGYGIAKNFPKAERNYDAFTLYFTKAFHDDWLAQVSYTWSYLRGNYAGLFQPGAGFIQANHSGAFDTMGLTLNKYGPLPGDHRHDFRIFGAKDWVLTRENRISTGLSLHGHSGGPTNYLGAYADYGPGDSYLLPAGSRALRLPWEFGTDIQLGYRYNLDKDKSLTFTIDVFNLLNFQQVIGVDEIYTKQNVLGGASLRDAVKTDDNTPLTNADVNKNFGNPIAYQDPRVFRFGVRATF